MRIDVADLGGTKVGLVQVPMMQEGQRLMDTQEPTWEKAIAQILEASSGPMHYRDIAHAILANGIKTSDGYTPDRTVVAILSGRMSNDGTVVRLGQGVYQLASGPADEANGGDDSPEIENAVITIASYGLYWEKTKVLWWPGHTGRIRLLGKAMDAKEPVDFADQQGIYLLHKGMDVMYVGRAAGENRALFYRLRAHHDDLSKAPLWDRFSWFGFREVQSNGELKNLDDSSVVPIKGLITILETTLIQSCLPRLNGQRGELLGTIYQQVKDPALKRQT